MKSKIEIELDRKFERMGVRPKIYHFTENVYPFRAVTIATERNITWKEGRTLLDDIIGSFFDSLKHQQASKTKEAFEREGYGVAICDIRDQFSRKRGRIIAKGRLFNLNK